MQRLRDHGIHVQFQRLRRGTHHIRQRPADRIAHRAQHGTGADDRPSIVFVDAGAAFQLFRQIVAQQQIGYEHAVDHAIAMFSDQSVPLPARRVRRDQTGHDQGSILGFKIQRIGNTGKSGQGRGSQSEAWGGEQPHQRGAVAMVAGYAQQRENIAHFGAFEHCGISDRHSAQTGLLQRLLEQRHFCLRTEQHRNASLMLATLAGRGVARDGFMAESHHTVDLLPQGLVAEHANRAGWGIV